MAPTHAARDSTSTAAAPPTVSLWKKLLTHRRQHWVIRFLNQLDAALRERTIRNQPGEGLATWLLRYRPEFRAIQQANSAPAVRYYLANCPEEMTPLAVWLLGRCTERCRLYDLPHFARDASPIVRRHAARALRRLEAWSQLAEVARSFPEDARLQWYAHASIIKRPHDERLRSFTRFLDASNAPAAAGPSRMPLWFRDLDWFRSPPKSVEYIRHILLRIHRLVRGGPL